VKLRCWVLSVAFVAVGVVPGVSSASAATLCVGGAPGCFATIQEAVDAAGDGDRIVVDPGTFDGGITIDDVDVRLIGAGADQTVMRTDSSMPVTSFR
jgi:pectin methylesterase-like acyl-CoA thioesterase